MICLAEADGQRQLGMARKAQGGTGSDGVTGTPKQLGTFRHHLVGWVGCGWVGWLGRFVGLVGLVRLLVGWFGPFKI